MRSGVRAKAGLSNFRQRGAPAAQLGTQQGTWSPPPTEPLWGDWKAWLRVLEKDPRLWDTHTRRTVAGAGRVAVSPSHMLREGGRASAETRGPRLLALSTSRWDPDGPGGPGVHQAVGPRFGAAENGKLRRLTQGCLQPQRKADVPPVTLCPQGPERLRLW